MKYNFQLELSSKNSLSLILKKVTQGATVLEFGPAAGRMTKYMQETLNCKVYIVEIDEEAAKIASAYAKETIIGNIEDYIWYSKFKDIKFDFIIFADVLEHLYDPHTVLNRAQTLLAENGSIITSVPNIAHNSVIIDLLQNKFNYRRTGLLDDTHIRFFTHESLHGMINSCNLTAIWEEAIIKKVGDTELNNYFDELPKGVVKYLKNRPLCDIYQFVVQLQPKLAYSDSLNKVSNLGRTGDYYYTQLYVDCGGGFNEDSSIRLRAFVEKQIHTYEFDLSDFENVEEIRFDPLNVDCTIEMLEMYCLDEKGEQVKVEGLHANTELNFKQIYVFLSDDPQIHFKTSSRKIKSFFVRFRVVNYETDNFEWLINLFREMNEYTLNHNKDEYESKLQEFSEINRLLKMDSEMINNQLNIIIEEKTELVQRLKVIESELELLTTGKKQMEEKVNKLSSSLQNYENDLLEANKQIVALNQEVQLKQNEIAKIYSTKLGRLLRKLTK